MSVVQVSRTIKAPVAEVWSALADFGGVYRFSGGVKTSPINEGTPSSGVGAERLCTLHDGNTLEERVTESVDMRRISIEIFNSSTPIASADSTFELAPAAGGGAEVKVVVDFALKYGPLGAAMDPGLDHHLATGEEIGQGWKEAA